MHFLQAINSDISVHIVCNKTGGTIKGDIKKKYLLQFKVQENETSVNEQPSVSYVTVELTHPTLSTLLDGMRRIRDQLSSVAGRKLPFGF